ncbi:11810_t:CDS:2 [Cetraspora pellucida]|uniref:11810_t:CDS:1 n=1 Tax=Cetraspora pellucida TaxID=1433469 RepID=A0ACA9MBB3_9GLOM|nr:11810_t:CDS:2 [Cetraspora pellucida]
MSFKTFIGNKNTRSSKEQLPASHGDINNKTDNSMDTFIVDVLSEDEQSNIISEFGGLHVKNEKSNDSSDDEESSDFYDVERIEKHRTSKLGKLQFLIKWAGWSVEYNSWVDASDVHATELVKEYWDCKNFKPDSSKTRQTLRKRTKHAVVSSTNKKSDNFSTKSGSKIQKLLRKKMENMTSFYLESSSSDEELQYAPEFKPSSPTQDENTRVVSFYEKPDSVHLDDIFYSLDWERDVDRVGWIERIEENNLVFLFW